MRFLSLAMLMPLLLLAGACTGRMAEKQAPDGGARAARHAPGWEGTYRGVVPCADCEGVETVVSLHDDGTYERRMRYLGKSRDVMKETGAFQWDANGKAVVLGMDESRTSYRVDAGGLTMLDRAGRAIEGALAPHYVLARQEDPSLTETYWKLVTLMGQPAGPSARDVHIILKEQDGRVAGSGGCNSIMGSYERAAPDRLRFGKMAATMMACVDGMEQERAFLDVLKRADSYAIRDGRLRLHRARMAPLAEFEAVYLY